MGEGWEAKVAVSRPVVRSHPGPHALIQLRNPHGDPPLVQPFLNRDTFRMSRNNKARGVILIWWLRVGFDTP